MSHLALPLIIKLSIGAFRDNNGNKRIGLTCGVNTAYYFKIKSLEGDNDEGCRFELNVGDDASYFISFRTL
jgi:hypothetical protein